MGKEGGRETENEGATRERHKQTNSTYSPTELVLPGEKMRKNMKVNSFYEKGEEKRRSFKQKEEEEAGSCVDVLHSPPSMHT